MNKRLEEQMKGMMETASLKELMPDFDKEAVWNSLQEQLSTGKVKKRRIALGWLSHAAAVLLAIAATWYIMQYQKPEHGQSLTYTRPAPVPALTPAQLPDRPVSPPALLAAVTGNTPAIVKTGKPVQQPLQPSSPVTVITPPPAIQPELTGNSQPQLIAQATPKKVKHYLDITPDNYEPAPVATASAPFIHLKLNKPDITNGTNQHFPIKELFLALGQ